ncbi:MAG TPA: FAD/NAD(P)-binding protein [Sphingobium sp.]
MPPVNPVIAIIGAGLSGTLLAINLLRHPGPHVLLVERNASRVARGLAYATENSRHLLNVRASNMSAFPDAPTHFLDWLGYPGSDGANRFVERSTFGGYIQHLLNEALAAHPDRLTLVAGEATGAVPLDAGWSVDITGHGTIACDTLILAQGNLPPSDLPPLRGLGTPVYHSNPWSADATTGLEDEDRVLLIGSGLTAIDIVLSLESAGYRGTIHALSRRGLRPRAHAPVGPHAAPMACPEARGSKLVRHVRDRAAEVGWRTAIDELRPHTQDMWRRMDRAERQRVLRHLRPFWDVHRHRLAPAIDQKIATLQMEGRLRFIPGKIETVEDHGDSALVTWRVRGGETRRSLDVRRIINCTGPLFDLDKCADPLMNVLRAQGLTRADPLALGLDVDVDGRVRDNGGVAQDNLLAVGPMTRGECWEIVAVPDIRRQVWELARYLTDQLAASAAGRAA